MKVLNKQAQAKHYVYVVIWLICIAGAFIYLINRELSLFDPRAVLSEVSSENLVAHVSVSLDTKKNNPVIKNTLIHISEDSCNCNRYTKEHSLALNKLALERGFSVKYLSIGDLNELPYIPSTPAVMLVGNNNELVYFGPYSQGLGCGEDNSMVEVIWKNYQKGFNAEVIFNESQGCYCNRPVPDKMAS